MTTRDSVPFRHKISDFLISFRHFIEGNGAASSHYYQYFYEDFFSLLFQKADDGLEHEIIYAF